jgi:methylmalonyl-CoA/ethylmalonyl-CoA epimerase
MQSNAVLHHIGYAVKSIADSAPRYAQELGCTWDGVITHDPLQQARVTFLLAGNGLAAAPQVELIEGDSEDAPLTRFVAKGGGLHHLCYEVRDLDDYLKQMRAQGAAFIKKAEPAVAFGGRRVAWMLSRPNLLLEYLEVL